MARLRRFLAVFCGTGVGGGFAGGGSDDTVAAITSATSF